MTFTEYLKTPDRSDVQAFGTCAAIGIVTVLALIDSFACVVLLIASIVFMKSGHKGMAFLCAIVNICIPDALPLVDEIIQVVTVVIPMYNNYKNTLSIKQAAKAGIDSRKEYNRNKKAVDLVNQGINKGKDLLQ